MRRRQFPKAQLRSLLEPHFRLTGSGVARRILENWEGETSRFVRVMPKGYAQVLMQKEEQE